MRKIIDAKKPHVVVVPRKSKVVILRTPSPLDGFGYEVLDRPDGKKAYRCVSDIKSLMNEERLMQLNPQYVKQMFDAVRGSDVDTSGLSDDVLMNAIKSRYIQSNADVYNYTRAIQDDINYEVAEIKLRAQEMQAAQAAQAVSQQSVEPS